MRIKTSKSETAKELILRADGDDQIVAEVDGTMVTIRHRLNRSTIGAVYDLTWEDLTKILLEMEAA